MGITSQADGTGWNLEAVHTGITKTKTGGAAMHMAPQIPHPPLLLTFYSFVWKNSGLQAAKVKVA